MVLPVEIDERKVSNYETHTHIALLTDCDGNYPQSLDHQKLISNVLDKLYMNDVQSA